MHKQIREQMTIVVNGEKKVNIIKFLAALI